MTNAQFIEGWQKNHNLLKGFAMKLTKNYEDANDLLQETSLKAYTYRNQFKEGSNLRAWLSTIMRNTFINHLRRVKRRLTIHDGTDTSYYINNSLLKPERNTGESNVMLEELESIIESLDDSLKTPFLMYYQGYKYNEISQKLNKPLGTIKSKIFFARKELKSKIKQYYQMSNAAEILN